MRTGLSFERKGGSRELTFTDYNGNMLGRAYVPDRFDYVIVPLLFRATFGQKIKYFVNAGAFFGCLTKQTSPSLAAGLVGKYDVDNTNLYNRGDAGISAGLGILIPVKNRFSISAELRENYGLADITRNQPYKYNGTVKTSSTNFLLGLVYEI